MTGNEFLMQCTDIIDKLLSDRLTTEHLDKIYDDLLNVYYNEMSNFLDEIKQTPASKKATRHTKLPFWDEELSLLWKDFHCAERVYLKSRRKSREYSALKLDFITKQRLFDKTFRRKERSFRRRQVYQLEEINNNNPNEFWECIKRMGPRKKAEIPWEVYDDEGYVCLDKNVILKKWEDDFKGLLTPPDDDTPEQTAFKMFIEQDNIVRENMVNSNNHNAKLNRDFTIEEVRKVVQKAKAGKAPGIDGLISDVLKNEASVNVLC